MNSLSPFVAGILGLGGPEVVIILAVLLLLFGGSKLPELAKGLGKSIKEFKAASREEPEPASAPAPMAPAAPRPEAPAVSTTHTAAR
ncbi:MAG TPA: twin-arginine translocase TatA/TatE family subunit [Opitutaceae bacterium]